MSMGVASSAAFHSPNGAGGNLNPMHLPTPVDPAWVHRRTSDDADSDDDLDERTPTAAQHSAAYPVYSGADGDQEAGEVLLSQGHYEEAALRDPANRDKGKGKKLFGFATGGKDKRTKQQDRDRGIASSPLPRASREGDEVRLMSPPSDLYSLPASERNKEGGWMDRWNKRAHQQQAARMQDKEAEDIAASRIGWISANAVDEHDWLEILPLIDVVGYSEAASKEAARALRKIFKYGSVDRQRRAVRIWALLTLNASDRFRLQVASKRFLDAVEDTIASSKTPLGVKETMLRVLGVLAFEFRGDPELVSVTKCWNKVKPSDRPKDGEPLENDLFEFRLPQPRPTQQQQREARRRSRQQQQPQQQQRRVEAAGEGARGMYGEMTAAPAVLGADRRHPSALATYMSPQPPAEVPIQQTWPSSNLSLSAPSAEQLQQGSTTNPGQTGPDIVANLEALAENAHSSRSASLTPPVFGYEEDIRRLHEECQIAHSNATVLLDTVLHEGLHSETVEVVDEFYGKVVRSQEIISSQIPWASAQADRSRLALEGVGEEKGRETREERLLGDLLEAHGRTSEAIRVVEEARRRVDEEEEERRVTERSRVEVRLDRSQLVQDAVSGEVYDAAANRGRGLLGVESQASGSRSPSPLTAASSAAPASAMSPHASATTTAATRVSRPLPVPKSEPNSDSNSTRSTTTGSHPAAPQHAFGHSLSASVHSANSVSSSQSRDSQYAALSSGRSLPVTPSLNIRTEVVGVGEAEAEAGREDGEVQTPIVPSEKALGKRRALSVRYPTPPLPHSADVPQLPPPSHLANGIAGLHIRP